MDYRIEQISSSHLSDIQKLNKEVFGHFLTIEQLAFQFDTTRFGIYTIGFIAYSAENEPAAYYGVFPISMIERGRKFIAAQSGATMTSPRHQKKGLFITLANATYMRAAELGIELIYGFPNENSYPGFVKKLNWQFQGYISNHVWKNNAVPLCELSYKFKFLSSPYTRYCNFKLKKYGIEPSKFSSQSNSSIEVEKGPDFFEYKLRNNRVHSIEINGFKMLIKPNVHLNIGFVEVFPSHLIDSFIATLKQLASILGCRKTVLNLSPNHWLNNLLVSRNIPNRGLPIGFLPLNGKVNTDQIHICFADFDTY